MQEHQGEYEGEREAVARDGSTFEQALRGAEELLRSTGRLRLRLHGVRLALSAPAVLAPLVVLVVTGEGGWALAVMVAALAAAAAARTRVERATRRELDDSVAQLEQTVGMLREVFVHVSRQERWEQSRVRTTRERLARFSIEQRGGWR
ncbi:hypothetical protein [Streptomyces sp. NPDC051561]|uniref:hypothetical protein n=1 Tax=Streptomyces sp. NPDC051561 TaxID=3365658 RepID=UPI0037A9540A